MNLLYLLLLAILLTASIWDIMTYRIPNWLSISGWLIILVLMGILSLRFPWRPLGISLIFASPLFLISLCTGGDLGMGDVKLSLSIGAVLGLPDSWIALVYACLTALATAILILPRVKPVGDQRRKLPFAPFLTVGVLVQVILVLS